MKFIFKPAPHYRSPQSTSSIMRDLTLCLLAVSIFACVYYAMNYGTEVAMRVGIMLVASVVAALATEAIWFACTKQNVLEGITSSYGWVTAIILTLISSVNVSYYGLIICTVLAILFGKLVFGGFGQNIFNPAAFGAAVLMSTFAGSNVDVVSGATPTVAMNSFSWMTSAENVNAIMGNYGGVLNMFLGQYVSTMGSTCAVLLLLCMVFLIVRKDIDWQLPVFYIGGVFVLTLLIGLIKGAGFNYALFHVLAGGVLFGGVFMVTDPVTSPVTIPGKILFGLGAAVFTVIFRLRSNMPDGVLYSILIMNMLTPALDKIFDGNQIKNASSILKKVLIGSCCFLLVGMGVGAIAEVKEGSVPSASGSSVALDVDVDFGEPISLSKDLATYKAEAEEVSNDGTTAVYHVTARGFGLLDPDGIASHTGHEYSRNEADITVDVTTMTVKDIELTHFGDTEGIGDIATQEGVLNGHIGKSLDDSIDCVTTATYTSESVAAMVQAALNAAAGN
ncbi:MAG: RnfABCDGE type electron transport complex subunit D [Solobacterium sp.]|nr:RnfABCDGE type electron transport complex subunit D [Solobacterium sp.]